eukprot:12863-Heterococcus_DN1.PRE.1
MTASPAALAAYGRRQSGSLCIPLLRSSVRATSKQCASSCFDAAYCVCTSLTRYAHRLCVNIYNLQP